MTTAQAAVRRAQIWPTDHTLAAAVLDSLSDATAVLDRSGTVIGVNHAERM